MAIPSLAMIPSLGNQMMQTAQAPTPLDAIRERRNEREKIEYEKKYKEAMAEKTLWEIEAAKKEQEREEQFRQYMQSRFGPGAQQPPSPMGTGGGPMGAGGTGTPVSGGLSSIPPTGQPGRSQTPFMDAGLAAFEGGFYDKAQPFLNMSQTYQSTQGQLRSAQESAKTKRAKAAYAGYLTGQPKEKIIEKFPEYTSMEAAAADAPDEWLTDIRARQTEARIRSRPTQADKPDSLKTQYENYDTKREEFARQAITIFDVPSITDDKGVKHPDFEKIEPTTYNEAEATYAGFVEEARKNPALVRGNEDVPAAAARMLNEAYIYETYSPTLGSDISFFLPVPIWHQMASERPDLAATKRGQQELYRLYLARKGVIPDAAFKLRQPVPDAAPVREYDEISPPSPARPSQGGRNKTTLFPEISPEQPARQYQQGRRSTGINR